MKPEIDRIKLYKDQSMCFSLLTSLFVGSAWKFGNIKIETNFLFPVFISKPKSKIVFLVCFGIRCMYRYKK